MNVSMESSIDEEDGAEKVEKETLDTTVYQPDYVTEVNFRVVINFILCHTAVQQYWLGQLCEEGV